MSPVWGASAATASAASTIASSDAWLITPARPSRLEAVQELGELVAEAAPLRDHLQLLVRVQVHLVHDHLHLVLRHAEVGQHGEVALRPQLLVLLVRRV